MNQPQTYDRSVKITRPNDTTLEAGVAVLSVVFAPAGVVVVSVAGDGVMTFETVVGGTYHTRRVTAAAKTLRRARLEARQWLDGLTLAQAEAALHVQTGMEDSDAGPPARLDAEPVPVPGVYAPGEPGTGLPGPPHLTYYVGDPVGAGKHGHTPSAECICADCCEERRPAHETAASRKRRQEREKKARYRLRKSQGLVGV